MCKQTRTQKQSGHQVIIISLNKCKRTPPLKLGHELQKDLGTLRSHKVLIIFNTGLQYLFIILFDFECNYISSDFSLFHKLQLNINTGSLKTSSKEKKQLQ